MRRGELSRVHKASAHDPKRSRVFAVVSRQMLLDSRFSTAICAPIYSAYDALSSQIPVGVSEGLTHESSIHCDELISLPKSALTDFIGTLRFISIKALVARVSIVLENCAMHSRLP
jgi:mRNA interferase MazF